MAVPTLLEYLAEQSIAPLVQTSWFSGQHVQVADYVRSAQGLYELGAILGRKFHDRFGLLVGMFCEPSREEAVAASLLEDGADQVAQVGFEPRDFLDLFFRTETERLCQILGYETGRRFRDGSALVKIRSKKMDRVEVFNGFQTAARQGIALGASAPQLTERLLSHPPDPENWERFRARCKYLPTAPPPPQLLAARETEALAAFKGYVEHARPDLLFRLGLWPTAANDFQQRFRALTSLWGIAHLNGEDK